MPTSPKSFKPKRLGNSKRGSSARYQNLYGRRWGKARAQYLAENPLCACGGSEPRCDRVATVVDHVIPHKGNEQKFWDRTNWQSLSAVCHGIKTATEDGGFGNYREPSNKT